MKNKLTDLNDHLFAQMERLSDESLKDKALDSELQRTKAITSVAKEIISNGKLALDAQKAFSENLIGKTPPMLGVDEK
ncbi:MAG: hypothetical protein JMN25_17305 [gamma proteobacterium endosymbiont of Lamellibrachia anaximandri]|nr:hypothetical protein [gamma proteobacterium endosymbiont of Lamellibrachia anaximandri]